MSNIVKIHEGHKKLRAFDESDWSKVGVQFIGLASIMGLKLISPEDCKVMIDFVRDEFKDFSFTEIQTAFKMNLADKLPNAKGLKTEPYGSFNINYVGTVLGLYRKYRTLELRKVNKAISEPVKVIPEERKDEYNAHLMNINLNEFNGFYFDENTTFTVLNAVRFFDTLKYFGIMPDYKDAQLWKDSDKDLVKRYSANMNHENRQRIGYLAGKIGVSDAILGSIEKARENIYKGKLLQKFIAECRIKKVDVIKVEKSKKQS